MENDLNTEDAKLVQIFLSYAREDREQVLDIYKRLKKDGFRPWMDCEDLLPGKDWELEITKVIRRSDFVLLFLSQTSVAKRGYVQKEFRIALDVLQKIPEGDTYLIPVRLDDCTVPQQLTALQWVNVSDKDGFDKLLRALQLKQRSIKDGQTQVKPTDRDAEVSELRKHIFIANRDELQRINYKIENFLARFPTDPDGLELKHNVQAAIRRENGIQDWAQIKSVGSRGHVSHDDGCLGELIALIVMGVIVYFLFKLC